MHFINIYIVGILSVHLHICTRHTSLTGFELFLVISSDFQGMYFISLINKLCILNVIYFYNKHAVQNKL